MGSSLSTTTTSSPLHISELKSTLSSVALTVFEYVNELHIALGAGLWGIAVLAKHGLRNQKYGGTMILMTITAFCLMYLFASDEFHTVNKKKIVVITGCDSGLGFSLALHLHGIGFRVLAGCLDIHSDGARQLEAAGLRKFELNVTSVESVHKAVKFVTRILEEDPTNELWALINNAGIMVFAEFEWQTDKLMFEQINVNLIGAMKVTKGFAPLLRQHQARLINISSHCALESLPGLGVYGASKAGIKGFTDALRVELRKYGVKVISFIPGSFPTQSNILAKQMNYVYEMRSAFTQEQEEFYGDYFQRYNAYLSAIANPNPARKLCNPDLYDKFEHALLAKYPKPSYKVEPLRYRIYHTLFKYSPISLRDFFVEMFVRMPTYEQKKLSKTSTEPEIVRPQRLSDDRFRQSVDEWVRKSPLLGYSRNAVSNFGFGSAPSAKPIQSYDNRTSAITGYEDFKFQSSDYKGPVPSFASRPQSFTQSPQKLHNMEKPAFEASINSIKRRSPPSRNYEMKAPSSSAFGYPSSTRHSTLQSIDDALMSKQSTQHSHASWFKGNGSLASKTNNNAPLPDQNTDVKIRESHESRKSEANEFPDNDTITTKANKGELDRENATDEDDSSEQDYKDAYSKTYGTRSKVLGDLTSDSEPPRKLLPESPSKLSSK